ncbi:MAG: Fe-S cluster assembly protein SufD [Beijerinckiaceae bacterium]|jgi:Fe-S cluster assembly protein SufD|nr:Fe-S cluster assembly protein SufD [Beijerinckiaceae bacterium]
MANPVVIMRTPAETALIERFASEKASLPGVAEARAAAFARFEAKGLPSKRIESYHYTDVRNLMRTIAPAANDAVAGETLKLAGFARLGFTNGRWQGGDAAEGVTVQPLADAYRDGVMPGLGMGEASDIVVDLNTAFARDGVSIKVAARAEAKLHLAFSENVSGPASILPRVIVHVGEGAALQLIATHQGPAGIAYQVNEVVELRLGKGSNVEHIRVNLSGDKAMVLSSVAATLAEAAELQTMQVSLGGEVCRHQVFVTYQGENAKAAIRGATMLKGSQHHDSTLVVDHAVPHGESRELFRTVVDDSAQGVFQGKIIVRPHAQKTDGQMASNALLLSDDAGMSNKPELEIFADDVVCAHGATCGALDENQLFYLQARGLPRKVAEALLVEAFVGEVIEAVSDEALRDQLAGLVSGWMQARAVS